MFSTKKLARSGLITALYVALCLVLAPFSFGAVQVRVSEALTLLPLLMPDAVFGVTLGCFLSNALASSPIDMVLGTAATFVAALLTAGVGRAFRKKQGQALPGGAALNGEGVANAGAKKLSGKALFFGALPPILVNAVVVGAEIVLFFMEGPATWPAFFATAFSVFVGQVISCGILGVLLVKTIERTPALQEFFTE